jgi:Tol biopolymer transport system component
MNWTASRLATTWIGLALCQPLPAQVTQRVSVGTSGAQGASDSGWLNLDSVSISGDGRYVAFDSFAGNLVPGDTNGWIDVFVRDRQAGTTEKVSVATNGTQGNGWSSSPSISGDGRYVTFESLADNFVPNDTNGDLDVFVRDRLLGTTELVSANSSGAPGDAGSSGSSLSADGRYVSFSSFATDLVAGDLNGWSDAFVRDLQTGTTELASLSWTGLQGNDNSGADSISADGRYVAFQGPSTNLVSGGSTSVGHVFLRDRQLATTEIVSIASAGVQGDGSSSSGTDVAISADGRFVVFMSWSTNLAPGDTNGRPDIFVRDRQAGTTECMSVDSSGVPGDSNSELTSISSDGRYVVFRSLASNLVPGDTNGNWDVFVRDRPAATTERSSVSSGGAQGGGTCDAVSISSDGAYVAFTSYSSNLVPADTNTRFDVFVRDRFGGPDFTTLCDPGLAGVIPCPCSNAPSGPGRGCDNSSNTGGAVLAASGGTYLSSDSLQFTTTAERTSALSIVTQWTGPNPGGVVFGMGVRCTSGTFKRLYTKTASGGSITAPNFGAGDPQVSVRSAALGNTILPGDSRWYLVYYRDPNVLGGCSAISTFNATQTGQATWSP